MKRCLLYVIAVLMLCLPAVATGHGMPVDAIITFSPADGAARIELLDPYKNPIPTAQLRAAVTESEKSIRKWSLLPETDMGVYQGVISPSEGTLLHLVADWPGEKWVGQINLPSSGGLNETFVKLIHIEDEGPVPWWMWGALAVAVGAVAYGLWDFFRMKRGAEQ